MSCDLIVNRKQLKQTASRSSGGRGAGAGDAEKTASETSTKRKAPPMAILVVESSEVFLFFSFFFCLWPKQMLWQHEKGFYSIAGNM